MVTFEKGELGVPYTPRPAENVVNNLETSSPVSNKVGAIINNLCHGSYRLVS